MFEVEKLFIIKLWLLALVFQGHNQPVGITREYFTGISEFYDTSHTIHVNLKIINIVTGN